MKIFFAGSIRGGRVMLPVYIQIVELLNKIGHTVVSEHVASDTLEEIEAKISDEEIFNDDLGYINECECLVADVTIPSVGVGYEICYAISKKKLVLCVYMENANVSAMIRGNRRIVTVQYKNMEELEHAFTVNLPEQLKIVTIQIPLFSVKPANTGNDTLIQQLWN